MRKQTLLLRQRRFLPLFLTQFLGAVNDNVMKNAMLVLLAFGVAAPGGGETGVMANIAAAAFIAPFFLFSATAGQLADKYDKARLARQVKLFEIVIVLLAGGGFLLDIQPWPLMLTTLFLLGLQSTLFGPIKYAILPQHLGEHELIGGNALVEAGTFVAILSGALLGGLLPALDNGVVVVCVFCLVVAVAGYVASRSIPPAPPPAPQLRLNRNVLGETWRCIGDVRHGGAVYTAILGISWFWLYGALLLAQFPAFARHNLGGDETAVTLLLVTFTLGIGAGSLMCERICRGRIEPRLALLGGVGVSLFGMDLAFAAPTMAAVSDQGALLLLQQPALWRLLTDLLLLGLCGGLFIVPLYAMLQQRSDAGRRARIIAANNIYNALFMTSGALAGALLLAGGASIATLFAVAAAVNAAMLVLLCRRSPEFMRQFFTWLLRRQDKEEKCDG